MLKKFAAVSSVVRFSHAGRRPAVPAHATAHRQAMPLADAALEALKETNFFTAEDLDVLADSSEFLTEKRILSKGKVLMKPGSDPSIWFIRSGSVAVVHETSQHTVLDGELIGHRLIVADLPVSFKVVALENDTEVYCVNSRVFFEVNIEFDPILVNIVRVFQEYDTSYDGLDIDQLGNYLELGLYVNKPLLLNGQRHPSLDCPLDCPW